jgi:hypothetical protein
MFKFKKNFFWQYWSLNSGLQSKKPLYCLSHVSSHFCSVYFADRVLLFAQVILDHNPPIYASDCHWADGLTPSFFLFFFPPIEIGGVRGNAGFTNYSAWTGFELQSS